MDLQTALKQEQERRGDTQEKFAQYLGISQPTLSRIYRKIQGPGGETLEKILARYPHFAYFFAEKYTNLYQ